MTFTAKDGLGARFKLIKGFLHLMDIFLVDLAKTKFSVVSELVDSVNKTFIVISKTQDIEKFEKIQNSFDHRLVCTLLAQNPIKRLNAPLGLQNALEKLQQMLQNAREYMGIFFDVSNNMTVRQTVSQIIALSASSDNFFVRSIAFSCLTYSKRSEKNSFFDRIFENDLKLSLPPNQPLKKLNDDPLFQKIKSDASSILFDALVKLPFNPEKKQRFLLHCFEELNYFIHSTVS